MIDLCKKRVVRPSNEKIEKNSSVVLNSPTKQWGKVWHAWHPQDKSSKSAPGLWRALLPAPVPRRRSLPSMVWWCHWGSTCLPNGGDPQEAFGVGNEATTPTTQLIGYQGPTGADGKGSGGGSPSNRAMAARCGPQWPSHTNCLLLSSCVPNHIKEFAVFL